MLKLVFGTNQYEILMEFNLPHFKTESLYHNKEQSQVGVKRISMVRSNQ